MPNRVLSKRQRKEVKRRAALTRSAESARRPLQTPKTSKPRDDGPKSILSVLLGKGRLSVKQHQALREYGVLFRVSSMSDGASLASCLSSLDRVSGGGGSGFGSEVLSSEWVADCRRRYITAKAAMGGIDGDFELDNVTGMIVVVECIAGRDLHPRDITEKPLEQAQVETALRIAGDLLRRHFRQESEQGH